MLVTTPQDLTDALEVLLKPLSRIKIPVNESALIISLALRFVPILVSEAHKIRQAQLARGADLEGWWLVRIKKSVPMVLPLFASALKRADTLALALEARGYRFGSGRCRMIELRFRRIDGVAILATFVLITVLLRIS
jgi:energy-coupling factor transport system permease protein